MIIKIVVNHINVYGMKNKLEQKNVELKDVMKEEIK